MGEFCGAYTFVGFVGGWFTPMIMFAVVQATNDARLALLVIDFFCLVGLIFVFFIDFDKGAVDAARGGTPNGDVAMTTNKDMTDIKEVENDDVVAAEVSVP